MTWSVPYSKTLYFCLELGYSFLRTHGYLAQLFLLEFLFFFDSIHGGSCKALCVIWNTGSKFSSFCPVHIHSVWSALSAWLLRFSFFIFFRISSSSPHKSIKKAQTETWSIFVLSYFRFFVIRSLDLMFSQDLK